MTTTAIIWVRREGRTCKLPAAQAKRLCRELAAGRGQSEICSLQENGYDEFLAVDGECYCIDAMTAELVGC
jgi:hypothetical protein